MKKMTLFFPNFEKEHLGKDVFLTLYYLAKANNMDAVIKYPLSETNRDFPAELRGVKLEPFKYPFSWGGRKLFVLLSFLYLLFNANGIDVLMTFHIAPRSAIIVSLYKLLNKKGKVYLKMDIPMFIIDEVENKLKSNSLSSKINRKLYIQFFKQTNVFSCETEECYRRLLEWKYKNYFTDKLVLMPNGFDEEQRIEDDVKIKNYEEKENLIITVGRLGSHQKNTEMLLESIIGLNLNDWQILLIGPIENSFKSYLDDFFEKNPDLKKQITLSGTIYNKKDLWDYYNRAKVFILTSRWESYGLVLNEANRFNNFILTTDVGIARNIIQPGSGCIIENESAQSLHNELKKIISGEEEIKVSRKENDQKQFYWENLVKRIWI